MKIRAIFGITKRLVLHGVSKDVKNTPMYGHHVTVGLLGGVNIKTGEFLCMKANQCNAEAFLQFLQYILDQYPNKHVVMVLDQAKIHHANIL
jgi:DDE superfamily endonuclease